MSKRVLMAATVPSMIGQFNVGNIRILQQMGYEVDVAGDFKDTSVWPHERVQKFRDDMASIGVECIQLDFSRNPISIKKHLLSYHETVQLITKKQYAFVHTHTPIASAVVRLACHKTGTRVIYTAHGFHFYSGAPLKNWAIYYPVEKILSYWTDTLITINEEDYRRAKRKFRAKKTLYVPGVGIDINKYTTMKVNADDIKQTLGLKAGDIMILSVGELSSRKNHIQVLEALYKLKTSGVNIDNIHYFICGTGDLATQLQEVGKKYDIKLHLLGFRTDVANLYKSCDLFAFPSFQEGLPVALMEAIACKASIICSNIRGNVDLVRHDSCLFSPSSVDELAQKLKDFIDGRENSDYNRINNEQIIENWERLQKFDMPVINQKMREIYSQGEMK